MRVARVTAGGAPKYVAMEDEGDRLVVLKGDPLFNAPEPSGELLTREDVRFLSPVIPRSKIVAVALNYAPADAKRPVPAEAEAPVLVLKPNTAVIGPDDPIVLPDWSNDVYFESELAVVIKTLCRDVPAEKAGDVIFGYTVANDVTAHDVQMSEAQWTRCKSFDTSCPLGPWIEVDPHFTDSERRITTRVNGELVQDGTTGGLLRGVSELVEFVSSCFTLLPGDVILTGTPTGSGPIVDGDRVECEVEGIGTLTNPVVRR